MRVNFMDEQAFLEAVASLADAVEHTDPTWATLLRERPAVYVPHRPYGTRPHCCEFGWQHPVHADPWEHVQPSDLLK